MASLRLILGDQLTQTISSLEGCDPAHDVILMCEVWDEATYVKHHKKKIAFLFSAMRHFAEELRSTGHNVQYVKLDEDANTGTIADEVARAVDAHDIDSVIVTHPGEYRLASEVRQWHSRFKLPVEIRNDNRFLVTPEDFTNWAKERRSLRMETFYRNIRRKYKLLMAGDEPVGGQWNFDADNRKPPKKGMDIPAPFRVPIDSITRDVLELVSRRFSDHFGDLDPFPFAVTRAQALDALETFIDQRLTRFGDFQDAMVESEPWMFHAHLSFYLNCGLLLPLECVQAVERAYHENKAPLNSVEGFIRQIAGWREFVRGIYWLKMPAYAQENYLQAGRDLPAFYWTAETDMNCVRQSVEETRRNSYAHHIQRLMVLGNFSLLAGIDPGQVQDWFLSVYADAYEWVELPNVQGMALFADGGYMASKPYAASGSYINKMSNYCQNCRYSVREKIGPEACPFNYLYWDFMVRNRARLGASPRMGMMYRSYDRMDDGRKIDIENDSRAFLDQLDQRAT